MYFLLRFRPRKEKTTCVCVWWWGGQTGECPSTICSWLLQSPIVQGDRQFIKEELLWELCGVKVDDVPFIFCFPNTGSLSTLVGYLLFMNWEKKHAIECFPSSNISEQSPLQWIISYEAAEYWQGSCFQKKITSFDHSASQYAFLSPCHQIGDA